MYVDLTQSGEQLWQSSFTHACRKNINRSRQERVTSDGTNDWFPHPSPDGRWLVFLSYARGVKGHPANQDVVLRLLPLTGGTPRVLAVLFGGQGTINVPSWSPDSKQIAFVSYLPVLPGLLP